MIRSAWQKTLGRLPTEVLVLAILSAITRFAFLTNPKAIVFDEVYFRQYALEYKAHTYYFDLHPPLGKLLLGLWGAISGEKATAAGTDPAVMLRVWPAFCGTCLIIVVYYLIRRLSKSRRIATLGAGLLMLDNAVLVVSRFTLMDSMLLLFGVSAVTLALAARERTGAKFWWSLGFAAMFGGMAFSVKATGLSCLGLVVLIWFVMLWEGRKELKAQWRRRVVQGVMVFFIPALVYLVTFAVHFALLPNHGIGDAYMPNAFQATLKGNSQYNANEHMSFLTKFRDLNHAMTFYENQLDGKTHPDASKWYTWPISKRSVYLYLQSVGNGKSRYIYEIGNPAVWWGTILGAVVVLLGWLFRRERFTRWKWPLAFLFFAWCVNWFPFVLITRPMFIYHYYYALIFSLSFVVIGLGALTGWIEDGPKPFSFPTLRSASAYWAILGVALSLFLFFGPTTYGLPITPQGLKDRMWLSTWR